MAISGVVTKAATLGHHQQSGSRFDKEVHLVDVMVAATTIAAVMKVSETTETHAAAVPEVMEVIPAMAVVTLGMRGARQRRQDLEVHLRLQLPPPTIVTRGEVTDHLPPAAVAAATATSRATTGRARLTAVAALLPLEEEVAPTAEAPMAAPAVAVATGDERWMHARWMTYFPFVD